MIIVENNTNVDSVLYSDPGDRCPFAVRQKIQFGSFINCGCAVVSVGGEKYEAYKIFHYTCTKRNDSCVSYGLFEFKRSRKKEFILRIVVWDRIRDAEKNRMNGDADLCMESGVYYLSGERVKTLKKHLRELSRAFSGDSKYVNKATDYLEQEVFMDTDGAEKTFRWRSPSFNESIQAVLKKTVSCLSKLTDGSEQNISSVEFVFENCPAVNEARFLRKPVDFKIK